MAGPERIGLKNTLFTGTRLRCRSYQTEEQLMSPRRFLKRHQMLHIIFSSGSPQVITLIKMYEGSILYAALKSDDLPDLWCVLVDKGYPCLLERFRAINSKKYAPGGQLLAQELRNNGIFLPVEWLMRTGLVTRLSIGLFCLLNFGAKKIPTSTLLSCAERWKMFMSAAIFFVKIMEMFWRVREPFASNWSRGYSETAIELTALSS